MSVTDTHDSYWECECDGRYIHPKTSPVCEKCGAHLLDESGDDNGDFSDARMSEMREWHNWGSHTEWLKYLNTSGEFGDRNDFIPAEASA